MADAFHGKNIQSTYLWRILLTWIWAAVGIKQITAGLPHLVCLGKGFGKLTVHHHVTPFGNTTAGHYTKVKEAQTLVDCVNACCTTESCNVAFFFNTSCFLIQCYSNTYCTPFKRKGTKFDKSFMVQVRELDENYSLNEDFGGYKTEKLPFSDDFFLRDASAVDESQEKEQEQTRIGPDLIESGILSSPIKDLKVTSRACVYGMIIDCPVNEHCVPKNERARSGLCYCVKNYERDVNGKCQPKHAATIESGTAVGTSVNSTSQISTPAKENFTSLDDKLISSSSTTPIHQLVVSAGENATLQLPENEITLSAYALKQKDGEDNNFRYEWTLLSHPDGDETGTMQDQNTRNLKLSKLRAGIYTFKVTVTGKSAIGEATVNVTVLPPERENKPPVAIIQPSNVTIKLPNKETVLDGSFSTDDDKIVKYLWEVLEVPIGYAVQLNETPTLQLKNLLPGFYRFKLTVTDSKGASNFTFGNVTVMKETDYPPTANAKSEVVIHLPQNEVVLNGNLSTDDKGIKSWEWKKSPDTDKAVDMEGTNSPYLHLSQLEVGVYKFILKVTDTADQSSTTEVHLLVKPESNTPPVAVVSPDQKITLPREGPVILDGSQSKDDIKIVKWHWDQIQGPKQATIVNANEAIAKLTGLIPGYYQFMLTVYDEKDSHSSAVVNVSVIQTQNMPPHANAGGDKTVQLPCDVVLMNGSSSSDDIGIVKYQWARDPASLAAGDILENSDKGPILKLSGLIAGRYLFRLTVYDIQGAFSSDTASLIVKSPGTLMDQVEIIVNADIKSFTQEQEDTIIRQLEMLLHEGEPIKVSLVKLDADRNSQRVIMVFVVEKTSGGKQVVIPGMKVVSRLKKKLRMDSSLLDLEVLSLDTIVCQNKCSGHGSCDQYTKHCVCEAFWMQDIFRYHLGDGERNCDWSILYVIIVCFVSVVSVAGVIWIIVCCCTRMRFRRPKKRHRYTLLEDFNDRDKEREKFISRTKNQKNSLMISESESDAIFDPQRIPLTVKTTNGISIPNGLVRDTQKVPA